MKLRTIYESWLDSIPPKRRPEMWNKLVKAHQMATSREDRIAIANALYKIDPKRYRKAKEDYGRRKKLQNIMSPSLPPVQAKKRVDVPAKTPLKFGGSQSRPQQPPQQPQSRPNTRINAAESKLISKLTPILTRAAKQVSKAYAKLEFREAEQQRDSLMDHIHNIISYELGIHKEDNMTAEKFQTKYPNLTKFLDDVELYLENARKKYFELQRGSDK